MPCFFRLIFLTCLHLTRARIEGQVGRDERIVGDGVVFGPRGDEEKIGGEVSYRSVDRDQCEHGVSKCGRSYVDGASKTSTGNAVRVVRAELRGLLCSGGSLVGNTYHGRACSALVSRPQDLACGRSCGARVASNVSASLETNRHAHRKADFAHDILLRRS